MSGHPPHDDQLTASGRWAGGLLTAVAMTAFAANSLLVRAALADALIDPFSLTLIRIASGGVVLLPFLRGAPRPLWRGSWKGTVALLAYAALFSFAYVGLGAGTGALIAFGAVQLTMVIVASLGGERPTARGLVGMSLAMGGLIVLVLPGLSAPPLGAAVMMAGAGIGWGLYSHFGRGANAPSAQTALNFFRASLIVLPLGAVLYRDAHLTGWGVALAATSGGLTSGLGYVVWYRALKHHTATSAAAVQLSAPVLAAIGGVALLSEPFTLRLVVGGSLVVGGIALSVSRARKKARLTAR